jgi:hypothetical protein
MRRISTRLTVGTMVAMACIGAGVAATQAQGGGGGAERRGAAPMFLDVNWTRPADQTGQTMAVQANVGDPNLELVQYGKHANCLLTSGNPGSETAPFSVWSGECESPFATTFRHRQNMVDLTGGGKIRWTVKTSGFHVVRPLIRLADGTLLVGDYASESVPTLTMSEIALEPLRWAAVDAERVVTLGRRGGPFNSIWVDNPDLSRVDAVGFVDLMPASGHGTGGYIHVSQFQVYGTPVPR